MSQKQMGCVYTRLANLKTMIADIEWALKANESQPEAAIIQVFFVQGDVLEDDCPNELRAILKTPTGTLSLGGLEDVI